jgi:uroporphyrinogen III methyltransferase/synthase
VKTDRKPGKVYLIGAGPGDPGLLTLKGRECLAAADVVIYDYLANPRLLDYAGAGAERIYVGKRNYEHTVEQAAINELLVNEAKKGRTVARLKGGDAFVFGRGGEEASYLAENNIQFEVVPGVTSAYAVPAYAGIPVTHRGLASDVSFITGHEQPAAAGPGISWEALAKGGGTLVFLMGVKNVDVIAEELIRHGKPGDTPVAIIRWGTTPDQVTLTGTLGDIVEKIRQTGFRPPAVIVVGEVVRLREKLAWFETKPLFGKRIVITRAADQAESLSSLLEAAGAAVIEFPTIAIRPVEDYSVFDEAIGKMQTFDWVVLTSANAVTYLIERLHGLDLDVRVLGGVRLAAVGTATAGALADHGLRADLVPADFRAEGLIEELGRQNIKGARILIPRAKEAREILPDKLRGLGAEVTVAPLYQNVPTDAPAEELRLELAAGNIDCITFTSGSTLKNFAKLLGADKMDAAKTGAWLGGAKIAVIGPVTAKTAEKCGLPVNIMPNTATIPALVKAIIEKR